MVRTVTAVIVPRPTQSEIGMVCTVTEEIAPRLTPSFYNATRGLFPDPTRGLFPGTRRGGALHTLGLAPA